MVGLVYLHTYLETLRRENWTIYVVQGTVPIQADLSATYSNGSRLWTPEEARFSHIILLTFLIFIHSMLVDLKLLCAAEMVTGLMHLLEQPLNRHMK